ncbi:MAG: HAD family hydrolase [Clostridia bacterium]|nr:HAD family hydrolase [Clostridia bacterium]
MYQTIIFDLDGTLLDTLDDLADAVNHALQSFGLKTRTKEEVRSFVGNGVVNLMQRAVGEEHLQQSNILAAFREYYKAHCEDKTKPYDGVMKLLTELKKRGIKTAVVSNKMDSAVKALTKTYFDGLIGDAVGENEAAGIRKKPAPDSLIAVMEKLGADKQSTVYVGDSEVDIQTADNAGVDCISVTWGFKDEPFLIENGGKIFVDDPMDILNFCKE